MSDVSTGGVSRRSALRLFASLAGAAILAACGGQASPAATSAPPSSAAPASPSASTAAVASSSAAAAASKPAASVAVSAPASSPAASAGAPKLGGNVRYGSLDDITSIDGHVTSSPGYDVLYPIFDRLTEYDLKQKPQPQLAESWDISPDYKTFKLNLRKGVMFHNGRELTSDDIKWNVERVRDPKLPNALLGIQSKWFTQIDTPDKYTVVMTSDQPRPAVFDFFEYLSIVDRNTIEGPDAKSKSIGTGPFVFQEWIQGDHFTATKNKNYWQTGKPYADQLTMQVIKDSTALVTQLESGALDIVKSPAIQDFVRLQKDPKFQALSEPESRFFFEGVNATIKPFDNKLVRQALAYTIDRKRFIDTLEGGAGTPQSIPWPSLSPAYEASKGNTYAFDLDKAKSLLAQAGVSNLSLEIWPVSLYPELKDFAQIQQADLAKIGVTLTIKSVDLAAWITAIIGHQYQGLYSTAQGTTQLHPATLMSGSPYKDPGNNSGFVSPDYTSLQTSVASETDPTKAKAVYSQMNDYLLDQAFCLPMGMSPFRLAARAALKNVTFLLHDAVNFKEVWLDG
ncbi:MAG: ABC transporter substrate-binding protein [Chloroflexi bacterium]|nr:ABC transporter substrate-binding protein [Chloroflexota bacterium]